MADSSKIDSLIGADVIDRSDRTIGTVGQVYVDSEADTPTWVTINTGLFGMSESFAPLDKADFTGGVLRLAFEKTFVKDARALTTTGRSTAPTKTPPTATTRWVRRPGSLPSATACGVARALDRMRVPTDTTPPARPPTRL